MEETNLQNTQETQAAPEGDDRPPLWKQVMGALVGGGLALALYYGYEFAKPQVAAYLTLPVAEGGRLFDLGATSIADSDLEDSERKRFASKNLQAARMLEGQKIGQEDLDAVENHSLDIDWPGHEANAIAANIEGVPLMEEEEEMEDMMDMEDSMYEQQMATKEMDMENDWDALWGDIRERESEEEHIGDRSNAPALPDSGFGIGFLVAGAAGGAAATRRKKKA